MSTHPQGQSSAVRQIPGSSRVPEATGFNRWLFIMLCRRAAYVFAYGILAVALAGTVTSVAVLHAWESPVIPGAAQGYRYLALGYRRATGKDFSGILSGSMIDLQSLLPQGFGMGSGFPQDVNLGLKMHGAFVKARGELVVGDFLQALHVRPLVGRLITLDDQRRGRAVVVLARREALRLFSHVRAALGKPVYTREGFRLTVIGVLPDKFHGTLRAISNRPVDLWMPYTLMAPLSLGHWPKGLPTADMIKSMPFEGTAPLLSVPDSVSKAQLSVILRRLFVTARGRTIPGDVSGFVTAQPYSLFPSVQQALQRRIRLALGLAVATLGLAAVNLLVVNWLAWLRRRPVLQIERVLGARRSYLLKRFAWRTAISLLGMLTLSGGLIIFAVALLRHISGSAYASVLNLHTLLPTLAWVLPLLALVVTVIQGLPLGVLMARESIGTERMTTGSDRWSGAAMISAEVLLAALRSVASAWAIAQAWHSRHRDMGFLDHPATVVSMEPAGSWAEGDLDQNRTAYQLGLDRMLNAVHAVAPDAAAGFGPDIGEGTEFPTPVSDGKRVIRACTVAATEGWLGATGARELAGRGFDPRSLEKGVVLIDAQVARALFGSPRMAVGGELTFHGQDDPVRVQGVVASMDLQGVEQPACPLVIGDLRDEAWALSLMGNPSTLVVGRALDAGARAQLRSRLTSALAKAGLKLKVASVRTVDQERTWLARQQIHQAHVFVGTAVFAWLVALSGIFAQLRLFLAMRRRLTAIHAALGARPRRVYSHMMTVALAVALVGIALALFATPWMARQFAFLSGLPVAPYGLPTWMALAVLLFAVAAVVHGPAWRATRADPAESLHEL